MADLTLRLVKGSPLTNAEVDGNFTSLNESIMVTGEPMGHANKSDSVLSFNAGTRTVSIAPAVTSFDVWCKGTKHTYTTAQTVVIPDTTGLHYVFFNASGVLSTRMSYFDFENEAPTAYVAWNSAVQQASFFADERHGVTLDWQTHEYLHRTRGAALANGFSISNYTIVGTGSADADAQFDLGGGTFFDEDLQVDIVSSNTPTPGTWQQDLAGPALIPVLYRSGTGWVRDTPTNFVLKAGTATPRYNSEAAGVWGLTDVPNNSYSTVWIIATNNLTYPVVAIMGQAADSNSGQVENIEWSSLNLDGFPSVEFRPLYKIVFQCSSGYTNTIKARFTKVFDIRNLVAASPAATIGSAHSGLSGLGNDDHLQYLHVTEVRSPSAAVKASFLPPQASNAGKYLKTDGSVTSWETLTNPNNGTLTMSTSGTGISGSATFTADQAGNSTFTVALNSSASNVVNTVVLRDGSGNFSGNVITANSFSGPLSGNASTASALATARTISSTGDVVWTTSFDGSGNATGTANLSTTGVSASSYGSATQVATFTVDAKGRITAASSVNISPAWSSITGTPTTLAGYGITNGQPLDADLTAIAALTGTSGFLKKTAADTWSLDTSSYATTTGGGATGTWSISISGNAATATSATSATSATTATTATNWGSYGAVPAAGTSFGNANTIGRSDANGYTYFNYINSNTGNSENPTVSQFIVTNGSDNFYRKASSAHVVSQLGLPNNYMRAIGYASSSNDWNSLGNTYPNTVEQVDPTNFSGSTNSPSAASYIYGLLVNFSAQSSAQAQMYISHAGNDLIFRGGWNGDSWQTWNRVLTNQNYNSYAPTLTGGGASGTWGINITGSAASATTADQIDSWPFRNTGSNSATAADSLDSNGITYVSSNISLFGQTDGALYSQSYSSIWQHQIFGDYRTGQIAIRGKNNGTWQSWRAVLDATNYTSYAPSLTGSGASGTWGINISGNAATVTNGVYTNTTQRISGIKQFDTANSGMASGSGSLAAAEAYGTGGGAFMAFHRPGVYAAYFGLDTDNVWKVGGWSMGASAYPILHSNNYNSYAPTLTGGGASGTWGISISGNAATATTASSASSVAWGNVTSKPSNIMYYQSFTLDANTMDSNATGFTYSVNAPYTGPIVRFSTGGGYDLWLNSPYSSGGYGLAFRTRNGDAGTFNSWQYPAVYGINANGGGALYATIYYDQNDTVYYVDPNSTSVLWRPNPATQQRWSSPWRAMDDGNVRSSITGDSAYWTTTMGWGTSYGTWANFWKYGFGGFDCWGGSTDHPQGSGYVHAQGIQSGLHYANSDGSSGYGWQMVGAADADSRWWLRGKWGGTTRPWYEIVLFGRNVGGDLYANIMYDSNDTGYYINPNGTSQLRYVLANDWFRAQGDTGFYFQDYGYGLWAPQAAGNNYGNVATYNTGRNGWSGYGIGARYCVMSNGGTMGVHDNNLGWVWRWEPDSYFSVDRGYSTFANSARAPIFYDSNDTGYYVDPNSTSNSAFRIRGGTLHGPNPTWGAYLYVGTDGAYIGSTSTVAVTNGNLHIDAQSGNNLYLAWYNSSNIMVGGGIQATIYYDRDNTGYYLDPTSTTSLRTVGDWRADSAAWTGEFAGKIQYHSNNWYFQYTSNALFRNSGGTNVVTIDASGNISANGTVAASSDERLKTNWRDLPADFVEQLAKVKAGVYDRVDEEGMTQVGVSAQSLEPLMPHAVTHNADGMLGVAYGNAALVAAVKLAERVVELERRLAALESGEK